MKTTIELTGMKFYAYHGVSLQEKTVGNTYFVDLELEAPLQEAVSTDNLADTINYAAVYELVKQEMEQPSNLIEHVAGRILASLKKNFPCLERIRVKLSKQNPPFGGDLRCATIVLEEKYVFPN